MPPLITNCRMDQARLAQSLMRYLASNRVPLLSMYDIQVYVNVPTLATLYVSAPLISDQQFIYSATALFFAVQLYVLHRAAGMPDLTP